MTAHPYLIVERDDTVLSMRLARPNSLNALTAGLVQEMIDIIETAAEASVRVIILAGTGRAFCAGSDFAESRERNAIPGANVAYVELLHRLMHAIEAFPGPVIAAVNGIAAGGGLELMLACDLAYADARAKIGDSHANYAMFPGGGATVRLVRRIGLSRAKLLMFTGRLIDAREALSIGLVDEIVGGDDLMPTVRALALDLALKSPLVLKRMKSALQLGLEMSSSAALAQERALYELHSGSADRAEGIAAFMKKRAPCYSGK